MRLMALDNMGNYKSEFDTKGSNNTWTEGKTYLLSEYEGYFTITSNEGLDSFPAYEKESILCNFKRVN